MMSPSQSNLATQGAPIGSELVRRYCALFANRLAFTMQSSKPAENGKHYYYRPKKDRRLSLQILADHLSGKITIGLYALNPKTQRSKWVAIDADYENSLEDLLKLQWELQQDGIESALERSRRGGHLWIFMAQPLLARDCRMYIYNLALRLKVPVKGAPGLAEGIEVFPRQDSLQSGEFGNAIRGPLGIHRGAGKRFWFYGADYKIEAQLGYLERLKKVSETQLSDFTTGMKMPEEFQPPRKFVLPKFDPSRREFRILDHLSSVKRRSRNYWTRCPSCAELGHDRGGDNLAICVSDPRKYKCWAGCSKEMIRAALGQPIRARRAN